MENKREKDSKNKKGQNKRSVLKRCANTIEPTSPTNRSLRQQATYTPTYQRLLCAYAYPYYITLTLKYAIGQAYFLRYFFG
jgi:hypothetical protein